ncbi:MAG: hypothetical protein IJA79_03710 [Desulfovibrio sp.]|nr:hypothetical protein [Desulfovibrio sp.]
MGMSSEDLLKAYMDMFRKNAREWARGSTKYEERHRKVPFNQVMRNMAAFVKRFIGLQKYGEVNPKLEKYLLLNNYIIRNSKGEFDVLPARYDEYKE